MKKILYAAMFSILVFGIFGLAGCAGAGKDGDSVTVVSEGAIIKLVNLDGGFYGIMDHWGKKYEPINLSKEFQEDGLLVNIDAEIRNDVTTTHMWGTPVEIIQISKVASG